MRRPPNILLLMTDQQRADTISAWGNKLIRTPTLDRLAHTGTSFTRCYTPSPVCVSARCALLTGLPPHVSGCVDNMPMPTGVPTLPGLLAERGYQAHGVGKMHFNPDPDGLWGFDSRDTSEEMPGPDDDYVRFLRDNDFGHVTEPHGVRSEYYYVPQPSQVPARLHHTTWVADRSIDFLKWRDARRPFFLMASFIKPHPPFENPTPFDKLYRGPDMPGPLRPGEGRELWTYWNRVQNRYKYADAGYDRRLAQLRQAAYYGAISFVDQQIGRILAALGDELDNTLVLFTADHGELLGDYGCVGKRSMLDAAARVPMIARMPGRFAAGRRVGAATSLLDVVPTCLGVCDDMPAALAGEDLADVAAADDLRRVVFAQLQRGRYAQYLAADGLRKYIRSEADQAAWHIVGTAEEQPDELARLDRDGTACGDLERALVSRFGRDGYADAVRDGRWVEYAPPRWPESPDEGLLFQDAPELPGQLRGLGGDYAVHGYDGDERILATPDPFVPRAGAPRRPAAAAASALALHRAAQA